MGNFHLFLGEMSRVGRIFFPTFPFRVVSGMGLELRPASAYVGPWES